MMIVGFIKTFKINHALENIQTNYIQDVPKKLYDYV